ncbi:MAG TPA: hypothetical protein VGC42_24255 [Kofleriaceae bacterium]
MRILTFKRLAGLAAIGGFAYVHKQRGGDWTFDSISDTARYLFNQAMTRVEPLKREMRDTLDRAAHMEQPARRTPSASATASATDEGGSSTRVYRDYKRKDDVGPH